MTDTDRTNIYSYRGTDFTGDLHDYLKAQGFDIRTVSIVNGYILVLTETDAWNIPQAAQWWQIVRRMRG
jgi:hypothetical protein